MLPKVLLACAMLMSVNSASAQFTMPLQRVAIPPTTSTDLFVSSTSHITDDVYEDDGGDDDDDDYIAYQASHIGHTLASADSTEGQMDCSTAINANDTVGQVDGTFTNDLWIDYMYGQGFMDSIGTGAADFVVQAHPSHPSPTSLTLRANLYCVALLTGSDGLNRTRTFAVTIDNRTSGRVVTMNANYNFGTGEWDWVKDDGDGTVVNDSGSDINEFFYVEHGEVSIGDTIRVSVQFTMGIATLGNPIDQQMSGSVSGWFDVIGY